MKYILRVAVALALLNQGTSTIADASERFAEPWQIWVMVICGASSVLVAGWVIFRGVE